ncbi:hypothetical protein HOB10_05655 [Candidatus Parcubacteria bacterium]|jgi:hypothetical protein|nr:hypothetical protein [Candidatus Parcubacteria bacterium]
MKNIYTLLGVLLIMVFMVCGCGTEQVSGPDVPEDPDIFTLHFGVTNDQDYVPFAAATIPMVTGGSGVYSYELYQDGQFLGHDPIQILRFGEIRDYEITLKVRDAETDSVRTATITVAGLQPPEGLPLKSTLYTADFSGTVPFTASLLGIASGGVPPYSYEMIVDDVTLYEDDNVPVYITEEGVHDIVFRVTDAVGTVAQSDVGVYGHEREEDPLMRINFIALPQVVEVGKQTGLVTVVYGGQAPFEFEIKVDGQVVAWEPTYMYQMNTLGELIAMVKVTDATGMSSEIGLSIFGEEPEVYVPSTTVDATVDNPEPQINEKSFFHADLRGEYDLIEWSYTDLNHLDPVPFGTGQENAEFAFDFGQHLAKVEVFYQGASVAWDTVGVFVQPPDPIELLTLDAFAATPQAVAPYTTTLDADPHGGVPPYIFEWRHNGALLAVTTTENIPHTVETVGPQLVEVTVIDDVGQTASQAISLVGLLGPGDATISWMVETNLVAGPNDKHDSETVDTGQESSMNRIWFYIRMDVRNEDREVMTLEVVYADGSRRYWQIPDVLAARPAHFLVDGGEALIEPVIEVNWYYPGGTSVVKCDGWNRVLEIHGSREVPVSHKAAQVIEVKSQGDPPLFLQ